MTLRLPRSIDEIDPIAPVSGESYRQKEEWLEANGFIFNTEEVEVGPYLFRNRKTGKLRYSPPTPKAPTESLALALWLYQYEEGIQL